MTLTDETPIAQLFRSLLGFAFPLFGQQMFDALGVGGGNSVRQPCARYFTFMITDVSLYEKLLAGLAIVLGIPFPIWLYYNGEKMRARNPLTRDSTLAGNKN